MKPVFHGFFLSEICEVIHDFFLFLAGHDIMGHYKQRGIVKNNL